MQAEPNRPEDLLEKMTAEWHSEGQTGSSLSGEKVKLGFVGRRAGQRVIKRRTHGEGTVDSSA